MNNEYTAKESFSILKHSLAVLRVLQLRTPKTIHIQSQEFNKRTIVCYRTIEGKNMKKFVNQYTHTKKLLFPPYGYLFIPYTFYLMTPYRYLLYRHLGISLSLGLWGLGALGLVCGTPCVRLDG